MTPHRIHGSAFLQRGDAGVVSMSRISRSSFLAVTGLAIIGVSLQVCAQQPAAPAIRNDVVIKNAVVMTVTHGNIQNGSVYIKDGKIAAVGKSVDAPSSATLIDAGGKYLTPGIIDSH